MAIDRQELEVRLKGWADEYGGSRYQHIGWQGRNILQTLIEHRGFVPSGAGYIPVPIRSAADEVERVVIEMETSGWHRQGRVLRCDYFMPRAAMDLKLRNLKNIGVELSRASYYDLLAQSKAYVAGALRKKIAA